MRIAYVINSFEGGGAALPIPAIVGVCRSLGHSVRVVALERRNGRAMTALEHAGIGADVLAVDGAPAPRVLSRLDGWVRDVGPTHIWTSLTRATLLGQVVGMRHGIPVTSWQHNAFLKPGNLALLRLMRGRSRLWVGDSAYVTELTHTRLGIAPARLMCWPIFRTRPDLAPAPGWQPGEVMRIGTLGRLNPGKGYDMLCRALVAMRNVGGLPPFQVMIGGEGAEHGRLRAFCQQHGLDNVVFAGYVHDTAAFLRRCHLYVQPSRREGFCIAAHEAMDRALPVIGSTVGEMNRSIIHGVTGWKVAPCQPQALADVLETALRRPGRLAAMGQAAQALVNQRYSPAAFARAGDAVLRHMAGMSMHGASTP
ncbi:glycosyltransferase [Komagataeibacter medellinensis]|uniref:Glycosyltransferase n=1 Tax=Komagataeibacter medellinensis TaxID=1177712 RepID=A0ABQ6VXS9_9PROT|nr:glycosyltransferase family 4 protein [Komagataeibacter medellinensis]KAB8124938.1 glycosyltransferase [Komagataeibacter medellinensis]